MLVNVTLHSPGWYDGCWAAAVRGGPNSVPGRSKWNFWWRGWWFDMFFAPYIGFSLFPSIDHLGMGSGCESTYSSKRVSPHHDFSVQNSIWLYTSGLREWASKVFRVALYNVPKFSALLFNIPEFSALLSNIPDFSDLLYNFPKLSAPLHNIQYFCDVLYNFPNFSTHCTTFQFQNITSLLYVVYYIRSWT